jgi:hypothetical protein
MTEVPFSMVEVSRRLRVVGCTTGIAAAAPAAGGPGEVGTPISAANYVVILASCVVMLVWPNSTASILLPTAVTASIASWAVAIVP